MLLVTFLKKKKITKTHFSKEVGVTKSAINQYCSGKRKPMPNIMQRIIKVTGGKVTPNDFYNINLGAKNND